MHITTKKQGYPSVLKTTGIAPKSAGIGSKFLSWRFFSWPFKPPWFECRYRVVKHVPALFKSAGIGPNAFQTLFQRFYLCWDNLYENVNITYISAFESARIGTTYASAFKSAGIGLEWIKFRCKCTFSPYILGSFLFWSLHFHFTTFSP